MRYVPITFRGSSVSPRALTSFAARTCPFLSLCASGISLFCLPVSVSFAHLPFFVSIFQLVLVPVCASGIFPLLSRFFSSYLPVTVSFCICHFLSHFYSPFVITRSRCPSLSKSRKAAPHPQLPSRTPAWTEKSEAENENERKLVKITRVFK